MLMMMIMSLFLFESKRQAILNQFKTCDPLVNLQANVGFRLTWVKCNRGIGERDLEGICAEAKNFSLGYEVELDYGGNHFSKSACANESDLL